jgi:hypothetical protein
MSQIDLGDKGLEIHIGRANQGLGVVDNQQEMVRNENDPIYNQIRRYAAFANHPNST